MEALALRCCSNSIMMELLDDTHSALGLGPLYFKQM